MKDALSGASGFGRADIVRCIRVIRLSSNGVVVHAGPRRASPRLAMTETIQATQPATFAVDPARLESGTWCHAVKTRRRARYPSS